MVTTLPEPAWMHDWLGEDFFADVDGVFLGLKQVTDADLEHLEGLAELQVLYLGDTKVTDVGLSISRG